MPWDLRAHLIYSTTRDDRQLRVAIIEAGHFDWVLVAGESVVPAQDGSRVERMKTFFDDHAHAILEPQSTLHKAMALAEKYGKWWRGSRATHFDCKCEDIDDKYDSKRYEE